MRKIASLIIATTLLFSGCTYQHEFVRVLNVPIYSQATLFNNVQYIPLLRFSNYYSLGLNWDLVSQRIELRKGETSIVMRPNSNFILVNGQAITLEHPVEYRGGSAYIPVESAAYISEKIFELPEKPVPPPKRYAIKTVVIDPGHGGKDPGAIGRYGTREKDVVLDISKRLKKNLEERGLRVYLTRDKDVFIPLYKRAKIAESKNADLFISVHANASKYRLAKGFEVYYLSEATDDNARALAAAENASLDFEKNNISREEAAMATVWDLKLTESRRQSKELAYYICNITSDSLNMQNRGVKGARFAVLKGSIMPAVLIEVGFLTNRREESKLKRISFRDEIANAISRSIAEYRSEYERTNGFSQ